MQKFTATIIFSGELDPNPKGVAGVLRKAGYEVFEMPEQYRPKLAHPGDYFLEVTKLVACDPKESMDAAGATGEEHEAAPA